MFPTPQTDTTSPVRDHLAITEVGPRDGLQNLACRMATQDKLEFVRRLSLAGFASIEVSSFVSPKAVPQLSDSAELFAAIQAAPWKKPSRLSALLANRKGLSRAREVNVREIAIVVAATDTMNRRNINMSLDQARKEAVEIMGEARRMGISCRAYVAVAFECPFEGKVPSSAVIGLAQELCEAGAYELVIADTIGAGSPMDVSRLLKDLTPTISAAELAFHFHDTRGLGVANAWTAIEWGVRRFDSSIGGLGGCPFAPGAAGNLATEDLVTLAEQCGISTGIDIQEMLGVFDFLEEILGRAVGGKCSSWLRQQILEERV